MTPLNSIRNSADGRARGELVMACSKVPNARRKKQQKSALMAMRQRIMCASHALELRRTHASNDGDTSWHDAIHGQQQQF
mmetsp:Transcript_7421/g.16904  ORF Transcript_7421/g.16904 Transcript_7421/m.16904 type:complete len:80 (-) Transcript_7421:185-424(-)